MKIGWIGLGVMGFPMAGHLARAGHEAAVFNRTRSKSEKWLNEFSGRIADTPAEASREADVVFSCVGNDDDLREITTGKNGAFETLLKGAHFVDCTTTSAKVARELSAILHDKGAHFLDAPVSGGQIGAENGQLTVMVGSSEKAFQKVAPVLESFARKVTRIGDIGSGQTAKMVNQLCIAGVIQGLAEGMSLADRAGLDISLVMKTLVEGAAGSWQMANRWETMAKAEYDFGFAVDWMRKDLEIALEEVARVGGNAPVAEMVDKFYADVQLAGGGKWDTSSLLHRLQRI